jgi:hypothetical protein
MGIKPSAHNNPNIIIGEDVQDDEPVVTQVNV